MPLRAEVLLHLLVVLGVEDRELEHAVGDLLEVAQLLGDVALEVAQLGGHLVRRA